MVARRCKAEPDNPSFLDSMGWVLYKRGKFAEAKKYSIGQSDAELGLLPDPAVLDHLGDSPLSAGRERDHAAAELAASRRAESAMTENAPPRIDTSFGATARRTCCKQQQAAMRRTSADRRRATS